MSKFLILMQHLLALFEKFQVLILMAFAIFYPVSQLHAELSIGCFCQKNGSLWKMNCKENLGSAAAVLEKATGIHFDIPSEVISTPVSVNIDKATINQILDELLGPFSFAAESSRDSGNFQYSRIQVLALKGISPENNYTKINEMSSTSAENTSQSPLDSFSGYAVAEKGFEVVAKQASFSSFSNLPIDDIVSDGFNSFPVNPISEADKVKLGQEFNAMISNQQQDNKSGQSGEIPFTILPNAEQGAKPPFALLQVLVKNASTPWGKVDINYQPPVLMKSKQN